MHHATAKGKQRLARIAVAFVLLHRVVHRLLGQAVLQLEGDYRQAVDEGAQIQRTLALIAAVMELAGDAETVGGMPCHRLGVCRRRCAVEQVEAQRPVLDALAQYVDHPAPGDLALQAGEEFLSRDVFAVAGIDYAQLGEFVGLSGPQKAEQLLGIDRELAVIRGRASRKPTRATVGGRGLGNTGHRVGGQAIDAGQVPHDQRFEAFFAGVGFAHVLLGLRCGLWFCGYLHSASSCFQSSGGWPLSSILRNTR